ncbi:inner membrane protein COX18 [Diplocarpon rosae]|nr:inner membrane protein COX18 [Diplocarpon rosae]
MSLLRRTKVSPLRPSINQFLLLPCNLRSRAFHASPRPQSILLTFIDASHAALQGVHSYTGLPWAYSIPLFAVLLRCTIIIPISVYQRRAMIKQVTLAPLIGSWRCALQRETLREVGHLGPNVTHNRFLKKLRVKTIEIYRRNDCSRWKNFLGLPQLPFFMSVMEALRKMCGSRQGVLGMIMGNERRVVETGVENTAGVITGEGLVENAVNIPLETSMSTEGMLWFPNLVVSDPHLALPFILSATLLLNICHGTPPNSIWGQRIKRTSMLAALFAGPLLINVPSALLIYWISSGGSGYLQNVLLDKMMPFPKSIMPCKPKRPWKSGLGSQIPGSRHGLADLVETKTKSPASANT